MVEPSARFEEIKIPLSDPVHGLGEVSAVLGVPRWWPTGARVGVELTRESAERLVEAITAALARAED